MLHFLYGTDREKVRGRRDALLGNLGAVRVVRITDAHSLDDLRAALQGPGMFAEPRAVVLDGTLSGSDEAHALVIASLPTMAKAKETTIIVEGALDAETRKAVEKHAEKSEKFDAPKEAEEKTIFALANALQRGDKKGLWIGLMREYAKGAAPEAVHGLLFWGAKQMVLRARDEKALSRGQSLVSRLAALPHEARRRGEDLSYALERFALSAL